MTVRTTCCVLVYGDYVQLARRCLESFRPLWESGRVLLRLGANAPGPETRRYLESVLPFCEHSVILTENLFKYPLMWRLFHEVPLQTEFTQWWDDDSYLRPGTDPAAWLATVEAKLDAGADMLGSLYWIPTGLRGNQHLWVQSRPWYGGRPVARGDKHKFAQGAWWALRTEVIRRWQWPDAEIVHRGGDVMLGALCYQQGLRLEQFRDGVAINADAQGRESKSPRRGYDEAPVGVNYHGHVQITREVRGGK